MLKKYNKKEIGKVYTNATDILEILSDVISSVSIIDNETIGISLNKNIITQSNGHLVTITNGLNVRVAAAIHENPNIDITKVIKTPSELPNMVEKANKEAQEKYIAMLEEHGITINEDGSFNLENSEYKKCHL